MSNFAINFTHPWLLLVLIPLLVVAFIPYFRLNKKYRRTRNRITSLVLHIIVVTLATLVLSGMTFSYEIPREGNEIILLVDVSESEERSEISPLDRSDLSAETRDNFVRTALYMCESNGMSVGIVTFGFGQNYCVPFTTDAQEAYRAYINSTPPDSSATDIASALRYAMTLFHNPETSKIVVITDGKETDGNARNAISSVLNQKTKVDFVNVQTYYKYTDVQVVDVVYPDYHVKLNEECKITAVLESNVESGNVTVTLSDNGQTIQSATAEIYDGRLEVEFNHKFETDGIHEINFLVETADNFDNITVNNEYTSFYDLQNFNKILVLEGIAGQSENLEQWLEQDEMYDITVKNLYKDADINEFTVEDLLQYDQIILNNVSNYDLCPYASFYQDAAHAGLEKSNAPDGFDQMIYDYVSVYGGGLLTVGGSEEGDQSKAHAYNRKDMSNTTLQRLLPVQAIDYTPPLGVVIVIDVSGSMSARIDGYTRLHWAKEGAMTCLDALSERDFVGIMTLFSSGGVDNEVILPMTARTQDTRIKTAISGIGDDDTKGGTIFSGAIERAGMMLRALTQVEKRHIILVTDGQPGEQAEVYQNMAREFYLQDGTSLSVIGLGFPKDSGTGETMENLVAVCTDEEGVCTGRVYYCPNDRAAEIGDRLRDDLNASDLKEVNYERYYPSVSNILSPLVQGLERTEEAVNKINVTLDGFYGVKARKDADVVLTGNFEVPLYAQWKVGNGMVGSFMCDLNMVWSAEFMTSEVGLQFMVNAIENLMPVDNIRPLEMKVRVTEDNYTNSVYIFDTLNEGEKIIGSIVDLTSGGEQTLDLSVDLDENLTAEDIVEMDYYVRDALSADDNYSYCEFIIKRSGVYRITFSRVDAEGETLATYSYYKSFAYSEEYDIFNEQIDAEVEDKVANLAASAGGNLITDLDYPEEILKDFVLTLELSFDPRYLFIIIAIVLFLLDIIVRKFKFKWPHEWFRKKDEKFKK